MNIGRPLPRCHFIAQNWLGGRINRRPADEQGLFINLVALIMKAGGTIANDEDLSFDLADRLQKEPEWVEDKLRALVRRKIVKSDADGFLYVEFLHDELLRYESACARNKKNGKRGGRPNKTDSVSNKTHSATVREEVEPTRNRVETDSFEEEKEKEKENKKENIPPNPRSDRDTFFTDYNTEQLNTIAGGLIVTQSQGFRDFVAKFPPAKRGKLLQAATVWNQRIKEGVPAKTIIESYDSNPAVVTASDARYLPSVFSYLEDARYNDPPTEKQEPVGVPDELAFEID